MQQMEIVSKEFRILCTLRKKEAQDRFIDIQHIHQWEDKEVIIWLQSILDPTGIALLGVSPRRTHGVRNEYVLLLDGGIVWEVMLLVTTAQALRDFLKTELLEKAIQPWMNYFLVEGSKI